MRERILKRVIVWSIMFLSVALLMPGNALAGHCTGGTPCVDSHDIIDGQVTQSDIKRNAVRGKHIRRNSVTGAKVKDGSLTGADINPNTTLNVGGVNTTSDVGIGNNLDVAGKISSQNARSQSQLTVAVSTTSTSYVDIPGLTLNVDTGDNPLLIIWSPSSMQGLGIRCRVYFQIVIDGTPVAGSTDEFHSNGWELRGTAINYLAFPGPGPHTIKVQWKIDTGTEARLNWHAPGWHQTSQLIAIEL